MGSIELLAGCAYEFLREQCDAVAAIVVVFRLWRGRHASEDVGPDSSVFSLTRSENV
jgi:hypothetical protein